MQKTLNANQISAFYHNSFVEQQLGAFKELIKSWNLDQGHVVIDIGGGCGHFARAIRDDFGISVRVIDSDPINVSEATKAGLDAAFDDALALDKHGDEGVICFNLILHHLVSDTDETTKSLQQQALRKWHGTSAKMFVNEYI